MLGDDEVKSKVVPNSKNPTWNDEFVMGVVDRVRAMLPLSVVAHTLCQRYILRCLLYDQDEGPDAEDDFLGYLSQIRQPSD